MFLSAVKNVPQLSSPPLPPLSSLTPLSASPWAFPSAVNLAPQSISQHPKLYLPLPGSVTAPDHRAGPRGLLLTLYTWLLFPGCHRNQPQIIVHGPSSFIPFFALPFLAQHVEKTISVAYLCSYWGRSGGKGESPPGKRVLGKVC